MFILLLNKMIKNCIILLLLMLLVVCSNNSNTTGSLNNPPEIQSISANPANVITSQNTSLTCVATDIDLDKLSYSWKSNSGTLYHIQDNKASWVAPNLPGIYKCIVMVSDGKEIAKDSISLNVKFPNRPPVRPYNPNPTSGAKNVSISPTLSWQCEDPDGDPISYDIYFGKTNYRELIKINHSITFFNPGVLEAGESYSWGIKAKDDHGNEADLWNSWSFTVGQ